MKRLLSALLLLALLTGCTHTPRRTATTTPDGLPAAPRGAEREPLSVFCAGSLMIPFAALEQGFEAANPDIDVQVEAHGSIQVIRHVTDIQERIDVVASADHALLPMLMYATDDPETGRPYASWAVRFASNRMVLAYAPTSRGADELTADNWTEIITRPGTRVGLADPRFDACGYRQLMVLQLAETLYGRKTLFEDVLMGRFGQPIRAVQEEGRTLLRVPEVLDPRTNSTIVLRGSSVQLISLLQSGDVDHIFEYQSVVRQHGLHYVELAPEINLGDAQHAKAYGQVAVKLDMQRFASVEPRFEGGLIAYGLTIPSNAEHPEAAARFCAYMLGEEGGRIMAENHHPLLDPPLADHHDRLPELLRAVCIQE